VLEKSLAWFLLSVARPFKGKQARAVISGKPEKGSYMFTDFKRPSGGSRTRRYSLALGTLLASIGTSAAAWASTCVTVDEQRDGLAAEERQAAQTLFEEALAEEKVAVAREGCTETWSIYHVRLGNSVTVVAQSPRGARRERVRKLEDLPNVYSQMVRSILSGKEITSDGDAVNRRNVTDAQAQAQTRRVAADAIWYAKLGYGATSAADFQSGPQFGFGRRWELDRIGIDFSFLNFQLYQQTDSFAGTSVGWIELGADYFFDPYANSTAYLGAGLSFGSHTIPSDDAGYDTDYRGSGLGAKATLGYELFRASSIRLLLELDARLPFYRVSRNSYNDALMTDETDHAYAPTFGLSLGIGWGRASR
jgi:hypothetical protein